MFGPPVVTILMALTYPAFAHLTSSRLKKQETKTGLGVAMTLTMSDASVALLAAAAGIICGKTQLH